MKLKILMKSYIFKILLVILINFFFFSCRKSNYTNDFGYEVIEDNGSGTGTTTWTSDKKYLLDGLVFVNDGQSLTIEPGTVIRGKTGQGENASGLIVARGGEIFAEGTSEKPIVFTCEGDDLEGSVPVFAKGLWGGLIILGNAKLNNEFNEAHIEGIPIAEPRGVYGGNDDEDNSGVLKYISIRHGGTNLGEGNEINGLTLGGVGSGTTIEYIEVISNYDDGVEFFGGTVNSKHLVVAFNGDDAFDYDLGFSGKGQFWLAIQDPAEGDLIFECDGGQDPELGLPYSLPIIFNGTFIGRGTHITNRALQFSRNAGGCIANSIILNQFSGVYIQYKENYNDSYHQFEAGNLEIKNNIFWDVAENISANIFNVYAEPGVNTEVQNETFKEYFNQADNVVSDPGIEITATSYQVIPTGNVYDNLAQYPDWFQNVNYKGAFGSNNWAKEWTLLGQEGFIE